MTEKWQVGFDDGSGCGEDGDGIWILVADSEQGPADVIVMGGKSDGIPLGVIGRTNATLIAHAPELVEALEAAALYFRAETNDELMPEEWVALDAIGNALAQCRNLLRDRIEPLLAAVRGME